MQRNKICALILAVITVILSVLSVSAENASRAEELRGGIISNKAEDGNVRTWIDSLCTEPANGAEWYIFSLAQSGEYDLSAYEAALTDYLSENEVGSAVSRLKFAFTLASVGSTDGYISSVMNGSIGEQGVMSVIFGLHMLNNGYKSESFTVDAAVSRLLELRKKDGGWAISGQDSDIDVTAMAIQALSVHKEKAEVAYAIETALELISSRQAEDGGYSSYGVYNPESVSQVITALCSLGIDFTKDGRFIKNGITLIDVIEKYRLPNGSFSHTLGGEQNENATVQVFSALTAYKRFIDGKAPLYILDNARPGDVEKAPSLNDDTASSSPEKHGSGNYKIVASAVIIGLGGMICLVLYFIGKKNKKNFIFVSAITAFAVLFVVFTDFNTADGYYNGEGTVKENVIGQVSLTIFCDDSIGSIDSDIIPEDGVILPHTLFDIEEGDTVYGILTEAARKYGIQIENDGTAKLAYISGIAYLYEFEYGELSGWVYRVNGKETGVGCSEYKLSDGDVIEWCYTDSLGKSRE